MQKPRTDRRSESNCLLEIRVVPRSAKIGILAETPGRQYKVKLTSPPVDGAANKQLISVLAGALSIPRSAIEIVSGETSRMKRIKILGMTNEQVAARLSEE